MAPAYVLVTREKTRNPAKLDEYRNLVSSTFEKHPATFLARSGRSEVLEGPQCEAVIILEFPSYEAALSWYRSSEYQAVAQHRFQGGDFRFILTEGLERKE